MPKYRLPAAFLKCNVLAVINSPFAQSGTGDSCIIHAARLLSRHYKDRAGMDA